MTASVQLDKYGPDWPLGFLNVTSPGTPVGFMSLVDPNSYNAPENPTSTLSDEYVSRAEEIMVQALKPGNGGHGTQNNTGNIYICRKGNSGTGNRDDSGSIVATLAPGQTMFFSASPLNRNVWNPYRYYVDADNAGDGAFVTLIVQ